MIDCDHAATTRMHPEALKAYLQVAEDFGANPESLHHAGNAAGQLIQEARSQVTQALKVPASDVVWTSGGTQANQIGIAALAHGSAKKEFLVSPLEHSSVYEILDYLSRVDGYVVRELAVDDRGQVTPATLAAAINDQTALVVVQAANSITGIVQPIAELAAIATDKQVPLFCDAVQAIGKFSLDLSQVAGFSFSAHKFGGPKSCGGLVFSPQAKARPTLHHVFQQNGFLPGTLDTPGIVSTAVALATTLAAPATDLQALKDLVLATVAPTIRPVAPWADYPGIVGLILPHTPGQAAATKLGQQGICLSTVSACSIRDPRPDKTLMALGLTPEEGERYIRLSFGADNTEAEIKQVVAALNASYSNH